MNSKLVLGVGINNSDYVTQRYEDLGYTGDGKRLRKRVWVCPFYECWRGMLTRCYSSVYHKKKPTYIECRVLPEWHYFMTFRAWMSQQDWEGKELDKDLLMKGNKIYGPDTCVFIERKVNGFLVESTARLGQWPIGVHWDKKSSKFKAQGTSIEGNKRVFLGYFDDPEEAHQAWLTFKLEQARILARQQIDPRVAKAIIERYENYAN